MENYEQKTISISKESMDQMKGWLDVRVGSGFYSQLLLIQLAVHWQYRVYDVHSILDEIGYLQGTFRSASRTKSAAKFKREPLTGLWHKHHFQSRYIMTNLGIHLERHGEDIIKRVLNENSSDCIAEVGPQLSHAVSFGAFEDRARSQKMTGEWVVYARVEDVNYFLTLGEHGEDQKTYELVKTCFKEFPEVERSLKNKKGAFAP